MNEETEKSTLANDLLTSIDSFEQTLDEEDRKVSFGLQGPRSREISEKYAKNVLNSWLRKALISVVGIPASIWFTMQIFKQLIIWLK